MDIMMFYFSFFFFKEHLVKCFKNIQILWLQLYSQSSASLKLCKIAMFLWLDPNRS